MPFWYVKHSTPGTEAAGQSNGPLQKIGSGLDRPWFIDGPIRAPATRVRSWNLALRFEDLWGTGRWPCPAVRTVGKTGVTVIVHLGTEALDLLRELPAKGRCCPSSPECGPGTGPPSSDSGADRSASRGSPCTATAMRWPGQTNQMINPGRNELILREKQTHRNGTLLF